MRLFFILLSFFIISNGVSAQDSWNVIINGKSVLKTSVEDESKNVITISQSMLKKKNSLIINYKQAVAQKDWERFIAAETEEATLKEVKGNLFKISNTSLQSLFKKSKTIKIYSWSLPTDPEVRQRVRIRRVYLCTLVFKG
jgi:hypothetical protein